LQLTKNNASPIDLLYVHPQCDYLLQDATRFQLLASEQVLFDELDRAEDDFGARQERYSVYRLCS
jgi:hypothetical protein